MDWLGAIDNENEMVGWSGSVLVVMSRAFAI